MKIAVIGSAGQLGRALCPILPGEVIRLTRAEGDLSQPGAAARAIESIRPAIVVNCAAYNLVDKAESEPEAAFAVNAWAVREIASCCRDLNALLIHFSTDYVFGLDSQRCTPWKESDAPGPVSVYGLSKLNGEYWVRMIAPRHMVLRTCGLYGVRGTGGKGGNFVETMLRVAGEGKPLRVVADQRCTPSFVGDVARTTVALIERNGNGLFHVTNSGDCSWHELAAEIFRQSGIPADLTPIPSSEYKTAARRPAYSVLVAERLKELGIAPLRPWQEGLAEYLSIRKAPEKQ